MDDLNTLALRFPLSTTLQQFFSQTTATVKRIFVTLTILSTGLLLAAFAMGWMIDDPRVRDEAVQRLVANHFLTAVAALMFAGPALYYYLLILGAG